MTDIVIPTPIDALPPAPQPTDTPEQFDAKAFASAAAQVALVQQVNASNAATAQNAKVAHERAQTATQQADAALGYRNQAGASAATATEKAGIATAAATAADASALQASQLNLGPKSAPPATDNQGQPLLQGATYYDTTLNKWRVWTGAGWGDGISAIAGVASVNGKSGVVNLLPQMHAAALYF